MSPSVRVSSLIHCFTARPTICQGNEVGVLYYPYHVVFAISHFWLLYVRVSDLLRMLPVCFFAITLLCFGLRYVCSFAQINICTSNTNLMMCSVCSPIIYFMFSNHISHLHQSYFQSNAAQSSDVSSVFLASAATAGKQPFVSIHLLTQQSQSTLLYFRITIHSLTYILESQ